MEMKKSLLSVAVGSQQKGRKNQEKEYLIRTRANEQKEKQLSSTAHWQVFIGNTVGCHVKVGDVAENLAKQPGWLCWPSH